MIELVLVLLKQLLTIPDSRLQKKLIVRLHECDILETITFMTQAFSDPFSKKLALHFLEINYMIFKDFSPAQIFNPKQCEADALAKLEQAEN